MSDIRRKAASVLLIVADELETRYGPHPQVPEPQIEEIAREILDKLFPGDNQVRLETMRLIINAHAGK